MLSLYQVDAFAKEKFKGNPAAVCPLDNWLDDKALQDIASEINLSETAFIVNNGDDSYHLRWFTPAMEVRLCGHATLASAHVLFKHLNFQGDKLKFTTQRAGDLTVSQKGDGYQMDFPSDNYEPINLEGIESIVGQKVVDSYKGTDDYMIILENEEAVRNAQPNIQAIKELPIRALIITARGNDVDFVSRVFVPSCDIDEDPVTGSAHTLMTPYWSNVLEKEVLTARQVSKRSGDLVCELKGDRVSHFRKSSNSYNRKSIMNLKNLNFNGLYLIALIGILVNIGCNNSPSPTNADENLEPALSQLNKAISEDSTDHTLYFARAEWFYNQLEYELAVNDLRRAIELDSNVPEYYHLLSDTYMDNYRSKEALEIMTMAADQFGDRIPTLLKLSETQYLLKQYEPSLFTVAKILTIDSEHPEAYFMMGLNFRAIDEIEKAINAFQTATELNPELVDAWLILGKLFENRNNDLAIQYYEAAINVNPEMPEAYHSKAFYLQNNDRIPEAIEVYKQINSIDRYYMDAYLNAGILYLELDSLEQAYDQFNIMVNLKSQYFIGHYYRGVVNEAMGNLESAQTDYQNCLNIKPDYSKALIAMKRIKSNS